MSIPAPPIRKTTTSASRDTSSRYGALDGLRGIAAISVLVMHASALLDNKILHGAYLAVDLFFMLSGFVLAHAYDQRLREALTLTGFMRLRVIRLYPFYILTTALGAAMAVYAAARGWSDATISGLMLSLLLGILFLPTPGGVVANMPDLFPFNSPAWSLFWELAVNALYGAVAKRLTPHVLCALLGAGLGAIALSTWWYGYFGAGPDSNDFWGGGARVLFSFFAGIGLWRLQQVTAAPVIRIPALALMVVLLLVLAVELDGTARAIYDIAAVVIVFPALIYWGALSEPRGLTAWVCDVGGRASYGVYVLQFPFIELLKLSYAKITHHHLTDIGLLGVLAVSALTVVAALMLDKFYDMPVRKYLTVRFTRRRLAAAT